MFQTCNSCLGSIQYGMSKRACNSELAESAKGACQSLQVRVA